MIHELTLYGVDLLEDESAGCKLMSHIIFSKLQPPLGESLFTRLIPIILPLLICLSNIMISLRL